MKIGYFVRNIGVSGGVKSMLQHVTMLRDMGYDAILITEKVKKDWCLQTEPFIVKNKDLSDLPNCDIYVGTAYNDVKRLYDTRRGRVVHYCQGYEPTEYMSRVTGEFISERYERKGLFSAIGRYVDRMKFKKRIKEIESIYALPTIKAGLSPHLVRLIRQRYGQDCSIIQGGINNKVFHAQGRKKWGWSGKIRILCVGSMFVGFKGIPDTYEAIEILKKKGKDIEFIRVSPAPATKKEMEEGIVDRYLVGLNEDEMADLYRETDIYISTSLVGEGLGYPAIEALACGVPSILTEIPSYMDLDERRDFACFIPVHRPDLVAEGIIRLIEDKAYRDKCIERGFEVAAQYTLERTKKDLRDFFERLR
ncbi:MAG TPA: glycosyltransferase family 4 protein [Syntrophorhabdaceae bacterium]|nr:glycosyltransferase family 4 protein [Syntrophorhabdaceae bacterium]